MKKLAAIILVLWSALVCAAFAPLYVPAINVVSTNDPCASLDSSTVALVARMTVDPGCPRKLVINNLIVSLKTAGVWSKLDVLYLFAAHDSQAALLNWRSSNYDATNTGATFTIDRGFTGGSSSIRLNSNFNPATASTPKYTRNDAHLSFYTPTNESGHQSFEAGTDVSNLSICVNWNGATDSVSSINGDYSFLNNSTGDRIGWWSIQRTSSVATALYKNTTTIGSGNKTSIAVKNENIRFLSSNSGQYTVHRLSMGSIGSSLDSTQRASFYSAILAYNTAVGA